MWKMCSYQQFAVLCLEAVNIFLMRKRNIEFKKQSHTKACSTESADCHLCVYLVSTLGEVRGQSLHFTVEDVVLFHFLLHRWQVLAKTFVVQVVLSRTRQNNTLRSDQNNNSTVLQSLIFTGAVRYWSMGVSAGRFLQVLVCLHYLKRVKCPRKAYCTVPLEVSHSYRG